MSRILISVLTGLGAMFGWGTADFFANQASEKVGHFKTFFWTQVVGLSLIALLALLIPRSFHFSPLLLLFIIESGIAYALGYLFFYKGFEIGNVSVVSAVINLQTLFIVMIAFFVYGQRLTSIQIPAVLMLIIGVLLVSVNFKDLKKGKTSLLKGAKESFFGSVAFGIFYWPVNEYIVKRADWLVTNLFVKGVAIFAILIMAWLGKRVLKLEKVNNKVKAMLIAIGLLDTFGILSQSFGYSVGDSIIISPISSALTIVTVSLAVIFLKEKLTKIQVLGIAMAVIGIVMISL